MVNAPQASMDAATSPVAEVPPARLEVRGVGLWIDERLVLNDVSLHVGPGELLAVLGPRGSGKSSLVRCVAGLRRPAAGTVWIDGELLSPRNRSLRARLGAVLEQTSLDRQLTPVENLLLAAALTCVGKAEARQRAADLLAFLGLDEQRHDPVETLSPDMRRRLDLARALIHAPGVLLLDEPTGGLDPSGRASFWRRLAALRRSNDLAVLLGTRSAREAEHADRVAVIDRGHVVACDTPRRLLRLVSGQVITVAAPRAAELADEIAEALGVAVERAPGRAVIRTEAGHELVARIVAALPPGRADAISVRRPTLADAFAKLTGGSLGDEEALA